MLFNSPAFIFVFLPAALVSALVAARYSDRTYKAVLVAYSLAFYAYWDYRHLSILLASIAANFWVGRAQQRLRHKSRVLLVIAIGVNLTALGFFKYFDFFISNLNTVFALDYEFLHIALPIGISFFTFQQVAWQVDLYRSRARWQGLIDYALFVAFFPQLIAGPIVHHAEMMPQFEGITRRLTGNRIWLNMAVGLSIFSVGLFKKIVVADTAALYSSPVFDGFSTAAGPSSLTTIVAVLGYTVQIYFDFSGYSDMAIGLGRMFGIRLPENFRSPYKATSIIGFWRRWHMTLSRFLRDYLYFPLGGNRRGEARRYMNLLITMVLGGLWHGANWTFVAWGSLHGLYLACNYLIRRLRRGQPARLAPLNWAVTFASVAAAWVFFRAPDFSTGLAMLNRAGGWGGFTFDARLSSNLPRLAGVLAWLGATSQVDDGALPEFTVWSALFFLWAYAVAWLLPNTQQLFAVHRPVVVETRHDPKLGAVYSGWPCDVRARLNVRWAVFSATLFALCIYVLSRQTTSSEFIYFQF